MVNISNMPFFVVCVIILLREECRLRIFENRILKQNLDPRVMRMENVEGSTLSYFIVCTFHLI